jgi:alanyl-tRNA synthetase
LFLSESVAKSEYDLDFFKTEGFIRQTCKSCGRAFWARNERELCGESPCIEYAFIGSPPTGMPRNVHETREAFLSFFERNGHIRVQRYPITARWRDDVFFTQASIYGFQPWVVRGVVEPPANPLTISQTCVRFNDVDNVGRTGSHFTMFEMMAHHVFNSDANFIYFKDRTVELCDRLMREDFGIHQDKLAYVEADWKGGGNSGPCFEVMIDGVEICTLVFMMYEDIGDTRKPLPMQVVDTGYGLERMTWLSQGTPSAYEAVFGPVLDNLKTQVGVRGDENVLAEYSKVAGLLNLDNPGTLRELREKVAARLDIDVQQLTSETLPLENIYVICDHTRALTFMLNDGVVPSNVKSGYFARMLVRRAMRALSVLELDLPLVDIVSQHIDFFKPDFPELKENQAEILELVDVESKKYSETLTKGLSLVSRMEEQLAGKGIGIEELVELYDSHGLNPEVVAEFARSPVEIPDDFYHRVAERHAATKDDATVTEERTIDAPKTELGFYEDSLRKEFEAKVVYVSGNEVALDKTYFYAESGGQEGDHGFIEGNRVIDTQLVGNVIVHYLEDANHHMKTGEKVKCQLNWMRRRQLMRHHTAAHIINAAAREVLGNHIWQTGAHKSVDMARLDITHYAGLTDEEFLAIEERANHIVMEDIPVITKPMDRVKAEAEYGMRLYQGGAVPGREIRVVNVVGVDVEACGGIHCTRTSEVGPIKILRSKRIQDGVLRLEFIAGKPLYDWLVHHSSAVQELSNIMDAKPEDLVQAVSRMATEHKAMAKASMREMATDADRMVEEALAKAERVGIVENYVEYEIEGPMKQATTVSKALANTKSTFAVLTSTQQPTGLLVTCSTDLDLDCGQIAFQVSKDVGGAGGGKNTFAQISVPEPDAVGKVKEKIRQLVGGSRE